MQICGNLKFDLQPDPAVFTRGRRWRDRMPVTQGGVRQRRVVLAAVWREGEDEPLLAAWRAWLLRQPQRNTAAWPLLLIVPRHPQRFDEVAALVRKTGGGWWVVAELADGDAMASQRRVTLAVWGLMAVAVVLLVMQVAGSGGTFPIETLPKFFQMLYPFLPFPHAIDAMAVVADQQAICAELGWRRAHHRRD